MTAALLLIFGFLAAVSLAVWCLVQASNQFMAALEQHCHTRGWQLTKINSLAGSWRITGTTSGIPWQMISGPNEKDSDGDWLTCFSSSLPFPPEARLQVMFRLTWNSLQSGFMRRICDGPLKNLTKSDARLDFFREAVSLQEIHGVGSPEFAEWYVAAGDTRTGHHLITAQAANLMMQPAKMHRPTLSIRGSELEIKPTTHPVKLQDVITMLEIGQIILRQAASGQRLSA